MAIYLCRSRPSRFKLNRLLTKGSRFRRVTSKEVTQTPHKALFRRISFKVNLARQLKIYSFKGDFAERVRTFTPNLRVWREGLEKVDLKAPVLSGRITKKIYRHFNVYQCRIRKETKVKRLILVRNSSSINQTATHLIFSKANLTQFGLIPKEDNSLEEIVEALLLYWQFNLESARIKVAFYRYIKIERNPQWIEVRSFLINTLAPSTYEDRKFPSPSSFEI